MDKLYIGLMSGTSLNGVDAVLLEIGASQFKLLNTHSRPYPGDLLRALQDLITTQQTSLASLADIDHQLAVVYSQTVTELLAHAGLTATHIQAIGSHGQTIYHQPDGPHRNTLQLGDPSFIAEATGITVVADLRRRDMAAGGQGAPLVPAFHHAAFGGAQTMRVIVNIGGIANITLLPKAGVAPVIGFDTGPGNTLLDQWIQRHRGVTFDQNGAWSATGRCNGELLAVLLADPYFARTPPKSTGREYFNLAWLERVVAGKPYSPQDVQATLLELTCQSITRAIQTATAEASQIFVCGGGAFNRRLMQRLAQLMSPARVATTAELGVDPAWVEAAAFAWLARQTLHRQAGNLPSVTGASHPVVLGGIFLTNTSPV